MTDTNPNVVTPTTEKPKAAKPTSTAAAKRGVHVVHQDGKALVVHSGEKDALRDAVNAGAKVAFVEFGQQLADVLK